MAKVFDCEDEPNEYMECPCMCDCGKWFDLEDGYTDKGTNKVVCKNCNPEIYKGEEDFQRFLKNETGVNYPAGFKNNPLFNREL